MQDSFLKIQIRLIEAFELSVKGFGLAADEDKFQSATIAQKLWKRVVHQAAIWHSHFQPPCHGCKLKPHGSLGWLEIVIVIGGLVS